MFNSKLDYPFSKLFSLENSKGFTWQIGVDNNKFKVLMEYLHHLKFATKFRNSQGNQMIKCPVVQIRLNAYADSSSIALVAFSMLG